MFNFDKDKPSKIIAVNTLPQITPDYRCDPLLWTPQLQPFYSRRIYILTTKNSKGRSVFRFYPLTPRDDATQPAFVVVSPESHWVTDPTTHICYQHKYFIIVRPLITVYYKAKSVMMRRKLEYIPGNLLTLIKHCYFKDLVSDKFVDKIQKDFDRLEKVIAYTASQEQGEARNAYRIALKLCTSILKQINKEVKIEK